MQRSVVITGLCVAIGLAAAVGATPERARADTTLVVSIAADPTGFDPEAISNNTSGYIMAALHDGLTRYKPGTAEVEPGLAQSWDIASDGLTYRFHLRHGVKFHDGTPFNARAYYDVLERQLNKNFPYYIYNMGTVQSFIDFTFSSLASYSVVDDDTIELKMKMPSAALLSSLAMVWNGIESPAAVAKYGKDLNNHPVGTGPFIFREWRQRDQIVLDANPDYWRGRPKVDRLVFKEYPDPQTAALALKRGEVQIMGDVATQVVASLRGDSNIEILTQPGLAVSGLAMPNEIPPFNDKRVRQALNYAVDKDAINKALYQGLATTLVSPLPESQWGFDKSMTGYPYDPEKAKQLLAEAGVKPGLRIELLAYNSARGYNPVGAEQAVAFQGYLQKVGIETDIRRVDVGAYLAAIRSGKYTGLFITGFTGDNGDPDNFVGSLFNSKRMPAGDTSHYKNPDVETMMEQAASVSDHDQRVALYTTIQHQIMDDAPWVFLNSTLQVRAIRNQVKGFRLNPTQMFFDMEQVSLQP